MALSTIILIVMAVAIWLAIMMMAATLPFWPGILKITRFLVCPAGSKMEVGTFTATYHRPGQKGLNVTCVVNGEIRDVKIRALLVLLLMSYLVALAICAAVAILILSHSRLPG
jgi:hypothetical protein